ncbi:pyruvate, phosphate dikinase [Candidatus Caldatribacterium sp.]|uniref:pyruvate, phosphate dikinase n=1 Tax=Candidatus Caldatribacterium sp. TaxID=2282143 RepID=UPI0029922D86|nr:pyruvate, phosphate dikinase [Candidatus Caldatribacterium sp.]MDW8081778.1 pyruvate, phosphate dikinase [Candidatus Calescibacterium sp.]
MKKYVYFFGEGDASMKLLLGGKGANLAEMTRIGLPVPPGFTITTEACSHFYKNNQTWPEGLEEEVKKSLKVLEEKTGKKFGDPNNPLLVSVRSGAPASMPGMMDTILNLGLNDEVVKGLARLTANERFAYDCYRRFIQMFGNVVMGVDHAKFEAILDEVKEEVGAKLDTELDAEALKKVVEKYKKLYRENTGEDFPQDPWEQLRRAINAVFLSWNNKRAITYRKIHNIPEDWGTAVNVQMMVFGNMGFDSGTGVGFTRNPSTGAKEYYGEYLLNAQGEDVVAGIRTPKPIKDMEKELPQAFEELKKVYEILEKHYKDMQDFEFTIERGKLYLLQTRTGKRTAQAAIKIAVDMVREGLIDEKTAVKRVEPNQINQLLHPQIDRSQPLKVLAKGLPASPGAASGKVVFDADEAEKLGNAGEKVILVRPETTPDDIHGVVAAQGVLTSRGGMTSHAAVVARGMGKPCVAGCEAIKIDLDKREFTVGDVVVKEGDYITIDGSTGEVILGQVRTIPPQLSEEFKVLLSWADKFRKLGVRANADTPADARKALEFGAEGIGLCRTEHMFMAPDRLPWVQKMIMAQTPEERKEALAHIEPMQKGDFKEIFRIMEGKPVTIRLIDPPLHEFLPKLEDLLVEVTTLRAKGVTGPELEEKEKLLKIVRNLHEANPMMGLRGCRLGILYPEIVEMQVRAIMEAACELTKEGVKVIPEIMIPLVGHKNEIKVLKEKLDEVAQQVLKEQGVMVNYSFGTMIEVPRAALVADQIAEYAEFFSFGTNDLTQMTFGYSRDDAEGKFLFFYEEKGILPEDPFQVLDQEGVGQLMQMAVEKGRKTRPNLKCGICGEHGGEPKSVVFCHKIGLNYVSCSPFRVPIARLAAAHAALEDVEKDAKFNL